MARSRSDDRKRGVSFTKDAAKEIAETVRIVRGGDRGMGGIKGSGSAYASSHYLSKTSSTWNKGSSQELTIYVGDGGSEAADSNAKVTAWNYVGNLPSGLWVVVARGNGTFYLVSFDYTGLPSYSASKQQVLGHDTSGRLTWIDTTACT